MHLGENGPALGLFRACAPQTTPRGRLILKPHRGGQGVGCFISLGAETALIPKTFETEWYYEASNSTMISCECILTSA